MSKARRRAKAIARQNRVDEHRRRNSTFVPTCMRCGQKGSHFVPPGFGDVGFYSCDPPADIRNPSRIQIGVVNTDTPWAPRLADLQEFNDVSGYIRDQHRLQPMDGETPR